MPAKRFRPSDLACPLCGATAISRVIDSRVRQGDIKRRRECVKCAGRFTTFERVEGALLPSVDMMTAQQKDQVLRVAAAIADDDAGARVRGRRRVAA